MLKIDYEYSNTFGIQGDEFTGKVTTPDLFQISDENFKTENNIDIKIAENNLLSESLLYRYERSKSPISSKWNYTDLFM